jgi:hypothetical protein
MRRRRRVTPSVSRAAGSMNGWSPGTIARFGSFLFCSYKSIRQSVRKRRKGKLTLGSAIPRDCTKITFCRNLTAANCTPACALGAHMSSMTRLFARESVSHCGRSFLFVHLCVKDAEILAPMTPRHTKSLKRTANERGADMLLRMSALRF